MLKGPKHNDQPLLFTQLLIYPADGQRELTVSCDNELCQAIWRKKTQSEGLPKEGTAGLDLPGKAEISQADKGAEGRAGVRHRGQKLKASKGLRRGWEGNIE